MANRSSQLDLFGAAPTPVGKDRAPVGAAEVAESDRDTAARLPQTARFGTSSWSFPGWKGIVWDREVAQTRLANEGLGAYARHPLLRAVGVDRTYYAPVPASLLAGYAEAVPSTFRFVVKAHEWLTVAKFPSHPRYGAYRGKENPHFLDAAYARANVVEPFIEGLGEKGGALVFQFPPQRLETLGGAEGFVERLHGFFSALPKGPLYAVEVRNEALQNDALSDVLEAHGVAPVVGAWSQMPPVAEQSRRLRLDRAPALVGRWMLPPHGGLDYEEARERFAPFASLQDEDLETRRAYADLVARMTLQGKPALVIVNNKAEGSAPLSVFKLAEEAVKRLGA